MTRWRPSRARLVVTLALVLSAAGLPLAAAPVNPVVRAVVVRGNSLLSEQAVVRWLGLETGMTFDDAFVRSVIRDWNATSGLGTLAYRIEPVEGGDVDLVLTLAERVALTDVTFRGNDRFSDQRLRELMGLDAGASAGRFEVQTAEQSIVTAYRDLGYAGTEVHGSLKVQGTVERLESPLGEPTGVHRQTTRTLTFDITEGKRVYVHEIVIEGNEQVGADDIRDVMETDERGWPGFIWPGWHDEDGFQADLPRIETLCRDRGYLDVKVAGRTEIGDDGRSATLHVQVTEGPLYRLASVEFEGIHLFRDDELTERFGLKPGAAYEPTRLTAALAGIARLYADQGYVDVTEARGNLEMQAVLAEEAPDVAVRFVVREGEPVWLRHVRIQGLTKTRENVVRRYLTIYPGERASAAHMRESERALLGTGWFDTGSPRPVAITLEPDEGTLRDAVVSVQEGATGRLMVGMGVGTESGLLGELSLVEENFDLFNWPSDWNDLWRGNAFRGGGQQLRLLVSAGTERSTFLISLHDPAVGGTDYSLGADLYRQGIVHEQYDQTRTGVSVTGGQHLGRYVDRSVTLGYEGIDVSNVAAGASPIIARDEGSYSKPFVRFSAGLDHRDSRVQPAEGYSVSGDLEIGAADVETIKLVVRADKYWTLHTDANGNPHVLALQGQAGMVDSYGGHVPVFERFYAGGIGSLRGFAFEGVSPVDPVTKDQIGGQSMLLGSLEYTLPITSNNRVRAAAFVDAGYVSEQAADVLTGWSDLRASAGVGLRFTIPFFGPVNVRLDLAAPLIKQSEDKTQNFHFSLGAERTF